MGTSESIPASHLSSTVSEDLLHYKYLRSLRRVTRGVTHDYNNILTGLAGQLTLLGQRHEVTGADSRRLRLLADLLDRGRGCTTVLFDFARYEEPSLPAVHSLDRIIDQTVAALQACSRVHRFAIEKQTAGMQVRCRFKDVVLALFYLGENALEATSAGGTVSVSAGVAAAANGRWMATVTVQDTGPGVPDHVRSRLFAPYVSTKGPAPPAGLGLYASRLLLQRYGGALMLDETVTGARFQVMLPCCETGVGQAMDGAAVTAHPSGVNDEAGRTSIGRQVFFIVEDDEAMRDLLVTGLQRRGHMVFCAETCAEAVDAYRQVHTAVTVLLVDIGLGDGDGYACAERLLAEDGRPVLLFMSGDEMCDGRRWATAGFVKKPFTINQLEEALRGVQSGRQG